jgi:hypothetical protein
MKWIESKDGIIATLKDCDLAMAYQDYIYEVDNDMADEFDIDPITGKEIAMPYEVWEPWFLECNEYENSQEFKDLIERLSDKD